MLELKNKVQEVEKFIKALRCALNYWVQKDMYKLFKKGVDIKQARVPTVFNTEAKPITPNNFPKLRAIT